MTALFAKPQMATALATPPPSPMDSGAADEERLARERETIAAQKTAGRRSTIVGGMAIAEADQMGRGLMRSKARMGVAREFGD